MDEIPCGSFATELLGRRSKKHHIWTARTLELEGGCEPKCRVGVTSSRQV
jgi:hypothetical protein